MPPKLSSRSIYRLDRLSIGLGGGFNYGGVGSNALYYLTRDIAVYGGLGSDFRSLNYSIGVKMRKLTDQSWNVHPYLLATYGFNGRLDVDADPAMTREYTGFSVGVGLDQKLNKRKSGFFTIGLLMPIHGQSYHDHADFVQQSGLGSPKPVIPVRLTFGYKFVLR